MATITLTYDSRNTSVKNILEGLLKLGIVKEKKVEEKASRQLTKEESQFKKSYEEALKIKAKLEKGDRSGLRSAEDFLNEL